FRSPSGSLPDRPDSTWYRDRAGSSSPPPGPRRRTTKKELSSASHRKSSPPRPKTTFLVSNCGGGDEGNDEEAGFSASAGLWFFSPSRSRRNTTWLGSQVCHSSPSPTSPSAAAILAQLHFSLQLLSPPLSAANPRPSTHCFGQSSSRRPGSSRGSCQGRGEGEASPPGRGVAKGHPITIISEAQGGGTRSQRNGDATGSLAPGERQTCVSNCLLDTSIWVNPGIQNFPSRLTSLNAGWAGLTHFAWMPKSVSTWCRPVIQRFPEYPAIQEQSAGGNYNSQGSVRAVRGRGLRPCLPRRGDGGVIEVSPPLLVQIGGLAALERDFPAEMPGENEKQPGQAPKQVPPGWKQWARECSEHLSSARGDGRRVECFAVNGELSRRLGSVGGADRHGCAGGNSTGADRPRAVHHPRV
uniref:Uncharacterized protein n=1 Tax=Papio anubis TaxID=9555 RepID=A0A2I3MP34_PAPAN